MKISKTERDLIICALRARQSLMDNLGSRELRGEIWPILEASKYKKLAERFEALSDEEDQTGIELS